MSTRNREAGHDFEQEVVRLLKPIHPDAVTCRSCNRARDNEGIDIVNQNEAENGRMLDDVQCKNSASRVAYDDLLARIKTRGRYAVVFHKKTKKAGWNKKLKKPGTQFMSQGNYAITYMEDYIQLLRYRKGFELMRKAMVKMDAAVPNDIAIELFEQFKILGLI